MFKQEINEITNGIRIILGGMQEYYGIAVYDLHNQIFWKMLILV